MSEDDGRAAFKAAFEAVGGAGQPQDAIGLGSNTDLGRPLETLPEESSKDDLAASLEVESAFPRIGLLPRSAQGLVTAGEEEDRAVAPGRKPAEAARPGPGRELAAQKAHSSSSALKGPAKSRSWLSVSSQAPEPAPVMHLRPAMQSRVVLDRGEGMVSLGLDMTRLVTKEEGALKIEAVERGGLVEAWNKAHRNRELLAGDYIVEVNGMRGSPADLLEVLSKERVADMLIKRVVQPTRVPFPGDKVPRRSGLLPRWSSRASTSSGTSSRTTTASSLSTSGSRQELQELAATSEASTPTWLEP